MYDSLYGQAWTAMSPLNPEQLQEKAICSLKAYGNEY